MGVNQWFRTHQKKFLVAICVLIMVAWLGLPALYKATKHHDSRGGTLFGKKISAAEVSAMINMIRLTAGERQFKSGKDLEAAAWQRLILLHEADQLGIEVTPDEIANAITTDPRFMSASGFERAAYEEGLRRLNMTPGDYEALIRDELRQGKLIQYVISGVKAPDDEVWAWYQSRNDKLVARYAEIEAAKLVGLVDVSEEALVAFFDERKGVFASAAKDGVGYKIPEKIQVEYVLADKGKLAKDVTVTAEMLAAAYEKQKENFRLPDEPAKPAPLDTDAAKRAADTDAATADTDAATVDTNAATADTDAAATAPKPRYRPLAEVADQVERKLRDELTTQKATGVINRIDGNIGELLEKGTTEIRLADLAAKYAGADYVKTGFFSKDEITRVLPGAPELADTFFGRGREGLFSPAPPKESPRGPFIAQVIEVQPERIPSLSDPAVRQQVENEYRLKLALDYAGELVTQAAGKPSFDEAVGFVQAELAKKAAAKQPAGNVDTDAAAAAGSQSYVEVGVSQPFTRPSEGMQFNVSFPLTRMEPRDALAAAAFALADKQVGCAVETQGQRAAYILTVASRLPASPAEFAAAKKNIIPEFLYYKRRAAFGGWYDDVRRRANPSAEIQQLLQ